MRCKDPWHKKNVLCFVDPVQYAIQCIVTSALNVICYFLKNAEPLRGTVALQFGGRKPPRRSDKVQAKPKTVDKGKQVKSKFQYKSIHFPVYY